MAVISIVGTSGVGKSFLVKQLAAYECAPAFFEGEEGVIPEEILESIFTKEDPCERWEWFIERDRKRFERARKISNAGMNCYVDGAVITSEAILIDEDKKHHKKLLEMIESIEHLESDKLILLIASKEKVRELTAERGRTSEEIEKAVTRAIKIQNEFIRLAKKKKNSIIIDRTKLDFTKEDDIRKVIEKIK